VALEGRWFVVAVAEIGPGTKENDQNLQVSGKYTSSPYIIQLQSIDIALLQDLKDLAARER
jgi:hypothetical protein